MGLKTSFRKLLDSNYVKNILVLAGGTGSAQLIGLITSPITRRIYTPDDYGLLSVTLSITSILLPLVTLGYIQAIMLPKKNREALKVLVLCIRIGILVLGILSLVLILFKLPIASILGIPEHSNFLFFIPFFLAGGALYQILFNYNSREKLYKIISKTKISIAVSKPTVSIVLGCLGQTYMGLFISNLIGSWLGIKSLFKSVDLSIVRKNWKLRRVKSIVQRYKRFPIFGLPATLANVASVQIIDIYLSAAFSIALLGHYAFGKMLLNLPLVFLGKSIGQVYYQQSVENKNKGLPNYKLFMKTVLMLTLMSGPVFLLLYFSIEYLVDLVYGNQWIHAAVMMKVMMPLFAIRFISSSVSNTLFTYEKQNFNLYINLILLFAILLIIVISKYYKYNFMSFLNLYTIVFSLLYFSFIILYYYIIRNYDRNNYEENI